MLDSINTTHKHTSICVRSSDSTSVLISDMREGPYKLDIHCPILIKDATFKSYTKGDFHDCHVPDMENAFNDLGKDLKSVTEKFEEVRDVSVAYSCYVLQIIWHYCPPRIMTPCIHRTMNWLLEMITEVEFSETQRPYEGLSTIGGGSVRLNVFPRPVVNSGRLQQQRGVLIIMMNN